KFLMDRLLKVSRSKIQSAILAGSVLVDDKEVKSNYKVRPGEMIKVVLPEPPREFEGVRPENIPLEVVYEDQHLMVVNKPAGIVVHPGIGNRTGTLVNGLAYYLQNSNLPILPGNMNDRPGLVHRIDKDTSGLLVIAKEEYAMNKLAKQFFNHTIEREYVALIWGSKEENGSIEGYIGRHPTHRKRMHLYAEEEDGKYSLTHYEILEDLYYVSLIKCRLETGRTHQIRVHFSCTGNPIFNDSLYGGDSVRKGTVFTNYKRFVENCFDVMPRQALHAKSLGFVHPVTEKKMYFEAPLPDEFSEVMDRWRTYVSDKRSKADLE
nr:RluA family pseudouridine synthase [Saprospiraceae bacterium]